jgi:hypothetical protein
MKTKKKTAAIRGKDICIVKGCRRKKNDDQRCLFCSAHHPTHVAGWKLPTA